MANRCTLKITVSANRSRLLRNIGLLCLGVWMASLLFYLVRFVLSDPSVIRWLALAYGGLACAFVMYLVFGPREVPIWFLPVYLPLFILAGLLSGPYHTIMVRYLAYRERRFVNEMRSEGRVIGQPLFAQALAEQRGTVIEEWSSAKGPVRRWWVDDDVRAMSPYSPDQWSNDLLEALFDDDFICFSAWCQDTYLISGRAQLVSSSYAPEIPGWEKAAGPK